MRPYWKETDRLAFGRWEPADLPLARRLWGDHSVTKLFSSQPWTDEQVATRLEEELACDREYGVQYWPLFDRSDGSAIGCCGVRMMKPDEGVYIFGFHLLPHTWGKGIATEAGRAVVAHVLALPQVSGIFAGHHPENHASCAALAKLGFKRTHAEFYEPTGAVHPCYMLTRGQA